MKSSILQPMGLALALSFSAALPQIASAQAVGGDLVVLNNGGRLRGVVSEYEPGVRVVIQLPDGTSRTVVAAEIASVTFADAQPVQQAPVTPPPTPEHAPPAEEANATPEPHAVVRWTTPRVFEARRLVRWTNSALNRGSKKASPKGKPTEKARWSR